MENDVQSAEQHDSARGSRGEISRRGVGRAAAWAVPVVAFAAAAPAYAASPPCTVNARRFFYTYWQFSGLESNRWQNGSALTATFQPGNPAAGSAGRSGLSFGADRTGVTVATSAYSLAITYSARFSWAVPAGWTVAETVVSAIRWKYTFTKTSATNSVTALTPITALPTNPDSTTQSAIPRGPVFTGTASQVTWPVGTVVNNGPMYTFPVEVRGAASALASSPRCRGPVTVAFDGSTTIQPVG